MNLSISHSSVFSQCFPALELCEWNQAREAAMSGEMEL